MSSADAKTNHATASVNPVAVDGKTVPEAYLRRVKLTPDHTFCTFKKDGQRQKMTWGQAHRQVLGLFNAYRTKFNLKAGDAVCIFSQSSPEWALTDFTNLSSGIITVPIYHSNSIEDVAYIVDHCGAKMIFADDEASCLKLQEAFEINKKEVPVVTYFEPHDTNYKYQTFSYSELAFAPTDASVEEAFQKSVSSLKPEESATIVYTSGTTGKPKGAHLTHKNLISELKAIVAEFPISTSDSTLTFLPFAHIFGRVESQLSIVSGMVLNFAENINTVAKDVAEVGPTFLVSVPRIYEKIYAKIQSEVQSQPENKRKIFEWAVGVGRQYVKLQSEKEPIPLSLQAKRFVADKLVFKKIRAKLGGNIRLTVSGGAPLARELCEFFHAVGIKIMEGYGLTETTAAITVNRFEDYAFGTVGRPLGPTEIRIAEDGEIQAKGAMIFKEYYRNKEATKECFTEDGWFCTGDIGEFTDRGMLRITDRKKELIVTSGGKKIAPQKLENALKGSRFISNCMVYGDKQKYIVALIAMNEPEVAKWAKEKGLTFAGCADLAKLQDVVGLLDKEVRTVNGNLASFESIKKFSLLPADFTVETGELTPSLKVKRKIVVEKYRSNIDDLYSGTAPAHSDH